MHNEDVIIKGSVRSERKGGNIYFFGKLWWCLKYSVHKKGSTNDSTDTETKRALMSIELEEISFKDFTNVYNLITSLEKSFNFECYDMIKVPGISITINEDMSYKYFEKALKQLFAIVFAETPKRNTKSINAILAYMNMIRPSQEGGLFFVKSHSFTVL